MLPFCRPADSSGYTKIFVVADVSAMTAWVDYIPVQAADESDPVANRVEALGYQEVNSLADDTGLTAFVDYIPVALVTGRTSPWTTGADGYIPVFNKVGDLGGVAYNPTFSNVQFLMNMNGADTSTTMDDLSDSNHTITTVGTMTHSTEQFKFGTSSLKFGDGTGDYLTMPAALDTAMSYHTEAGHFMTLEAWIYPTAVDELQTIFGNRDATNGWDCLLHTDNLIYINGYGNSTSRFNEASTGFPVALNEWTHIVVEKNGTAWKVFINGVEAISLTQTGGLTLSGNPQLGNTYANATRDFIGYMDAIRYTEGENVYSFAAFTPPTVAPAEAAETVPASSDWGVPGDYTLTQTDTALDPASDRVGGIAFNADGTKFYYSENSDDSIWYGTLSTPYDISTYTNVGSFDDLANVSWTQIQWSDDGTYFFVLDQFTDDIERFTCSTPYDLSTAATPHGQVWDYVSSGGMANDNTAFTWNADGTKLYLYGQDASDANKEKVFSFAASTPYDFTTLGTVVKSSEMVAAAVAVKGGMIVSPDESIIFYRHDTDQIRKFTMSTPGDVTTGTDSGSTGFLDTGLLLSGLFMTPDASTLMSGGDGGTDSVFWTFTK